MPNNLNRFAPYLVAILATLLAALVRWPLWPILQNHTPYMTFFPAVLLAASLGGIGPGLLATGLSALLTIGFLIDPSYSLGVLTVPDLLGLMIFLVVGIFLSVMAEGQLRALEQADAARRRAEAILAEQKRLEGDLRQRNEQLREADQRKNEFLALLGHELRNPLAPLRNAVDILTLKGEDAQVLAQARDMISRQVTWMTRLVEELLDASRITRGKVELRPEALNLAALVQSAVEDHRAELEAAGLTVSLVLEKGPFWIRGDSARLTQILGNLLHNAWKFTDRGGAVTVRLVREGEQATLSVQDTGIGLAAGALPRLFEAFSQADTGLAPGKGGLGLGLSVVKGLAELHGGRVEASSPGLGSGATFTVWLPLDREPVPATCPAREFPAPTQRHKVLVIDDNQDTADSLAMLLSLQGYEVATAYTGPEGVEQSRRWLPWAILCDLGLPGCNGFEVARRIRAEPATASVRLICISGYGQEEDRQQARAAGFDAMLIKPVEPAELLCLLSQGVC